MTLPLGVATPVLVGLVFRAAPLRLLLVGLLLVPLITRAGTVDPWWLLLLTLPIAAGLTFAFARIGQRWPRPGSVPGPEVRGRQIRLAILPKACGDNG